MDTPNLANIAELSERSTSPPLTHQLSNISLPKTFIPGYVIGAPSANTLEFASHSSRPTRRPKRPVVDFGLPPMSPKQKFDTILGILHEARKSLIDLLLHVLDPSHLDHEFYRHRLYEDGDKLSRMLDFIVAHPSGRETFARLPHALDMVCRKVSQEMDMLTKIDSGAPRVSRSSHRTTCRTGA